MKRRIANYVAKGIFGGACVIILLALLFHAIEYRASLQNKKIFAEWNQQIEETIQKLQEEEYKKVVQMIWKILEQRTHTEYQKNRWALYITIGMVGILVYSGVEHVRKNRTLQQLQDNKHTEERERRIWEKRVEKALQEGAWEVYYQPKVDGKTEQIIGAEALVRWKQEETYETPETFIPKLEAYGLIDTIDAFVLERVCQDQAKWKQQYGKCIPISINVSKKTLAETTIESYVEITETYGVKRAYLELEITESGSVEKEEELANVVRKMKEVGFCVSLDDFGTGYTSLSMLQDLPLDTLKIDKSFLQKVDFQEENKNMIAYILFIAKHLQLKTVVEGVETKEQVDFLKSLGCDSMQGYYYGKPMPIEKFEKKFWGEVR